MKIDDMKPKDLAKSCKVPSYFIHALDDDLIPLSHTEAILENYGGEKDYFFCTGNHNTMRPKDVFEAVIAFLKKNLKE